MRQRRRPRLVFASALAFGLLLIIPVRPQAVTSDRLAAHASWEMLLSMGDELAGGGEIDSALSTYRQALKFAATDAERAIVHLRLGQGLLARGDVAQAINELEAARSLANVAEGRVPRADIYTALEDAYRAAGNEDRAFAAADERAKLPRSERPDN
ncbi:MAG: hypothetical protein H6923_03010 [Alphaproteobacteria bacterium]|nr:hypothetical protein [Alphaproteobacteria bacterium]